MSESLSSPWIRDYLLDVAETHGAQLYNAPVILKAKKKVQLIDFLTYHENSYVWAWISDKDFRVSVRISKDAVDQYKSKHGRSIIDCRHSLVFVSNYRPIFSPRPLGPNAQGNTSVSHMSLEIGSVSFMGIGAHIFGTPRDLESDKKLKEWILGLRQDGGGGNVLKLRKHQHMEQNKKPPSPPPPPPFTLYAPVSQYPTTATPQISMRPESEQPQDFRRLYAKRWIKVQPDRWKFATMPKEEEQSKQAESCHPRNANGLDPCVTEPPTSQKSPPRTPPRRQGTPTDWSPSNGGSPIDSDKANAADRAWESEQHDEPGILPTTSQISSGAEDHTTETVVLEDSHSLPPPTPAQRIKHLPLPSSSPPRSSPEKFTRSSPARAQQSLSSTPPPPCSSPPLPSSSFPEQMSPRPRRTIQRKVPHPGLSLPRPDPTKQGPVQILVPNSDISGTGSSQSCSQSQYLSQSQQHQTRILPSVPSSLSQEFKPADSSTPKEGGEGNSTRVTSKLVSQPTCGDIDEQGTNPAGDKCGSEKADVNSRKQERSSSTSAPRIEVLEVGTSDTEEETDELELTHKSAAEFARSKARDRRKEKDARLSVNGADKHSTARNTPHNSRAAAALVTINASTSAHRTHDPPTQASTRTPKRLGSQSSMHSLFSGSLEDEPMASSRASLPIGRTDEIVREAASPVHVPRHDPEAWREPSFIAKNKDKGKARAAEEPDTSSVNQGKKRRLSSQSETPMLKRAKVAKFAPPETRPEALGRTTGGTSDHSRQEDPGDLGKTRPDNGPSCFPSKSTKRATPSRAAHSPEPRIANFVVSFDECSLGRGVPTIKVDLKYSRSAMLRSGWVRKHGENVERDGSVYIEDV